MAKKRLDVLLTERGLVESRQRAQGIIMSGLVYVNQQKVDKAGAQIEEAAQIEVRGNDLPYVSRGGLKLEKALKVFPLELEGKIAIDAGASTGGFTDCMLQNGVKKSMRWMWAMVNWLGHCAMMGGWFAWSGPMCVT